MGTRDSHPHSRRHFLLVSAAVPAATVVVGGVDGVTPADALGEAGVGSARVDTHPMFQRAGAAYGVPPALLAALSYAQTRWQDHEGRPSSSLGYGPMHLIDGEAATRARALVGKDDAPASIDTLGRAARAAGLSPDRVRTDPAANIRATAALLAKEQAAAGHPVGVRTDPADWFAATAAVSGLTSPGTQLDLADAVQQTLRDGGRLAIADGTRLFLPARRTRTAPAEQRRPLVRRAAEARRHRRDPRIEAPRGLDVEWVAAGYEQYGPAPSDYGNHDLANRPHGLPGRPYGPEITHIVIHDTEGYWDGVLKLVQDPTYVSWQYSLRSADGHIAQHAPAHDVCWHAGNWWVNIHSIGLEHEGFAPDGPSWFSEPMYRSSAKLVAYLARQHHISVDRAHIIGHDQVPGTTTPTIPGMHWDPGPFWDWEHYFALLGAPLTRGTTRRAPKPGDVVRILPGFAGNTQPVTGCDKAGDNCRGAADTNFVTLRQQPSADAPLVLDVGQHPGGAASTTEVADVAARASAGVEYVVAQVSGDWTAVWFVGQLAWFENPRSRPTARVVQHPPVRVRAKGTTAAPVYGRAYPEASAYPDSHDVQTVVPLVYTLPVGQTYVVGDEHPPSDYYKAKSFTTDDVTDHLDIRGTDQYVQISLGHRIAFVRLADVDLIR